MAKRKSKFREYAEAIVIAVVLALLIRTFVVQAFKIPSGSMIPTLDIGDHILVNKFIYGVTVPFTDNRFLSLRQPRRGDVMVFAFPGDLEKEECRDVTANIKKRVENAWNNQSPVYLFKDDCRDFIKRVIGVGGDEIQIKNKTVYINDVALIEPFTIHSDNRVLDASDNQRDNFGPITVPYGKFFAMGDNRDNSHDSRFWGYVDMSEIKGKAFIIYWSWDSNGNALSKVRWGRLGKLIN